MKIKKFIFISVKQLIDAQSNDTFCFTILNLINDKKVTSGKYFLRGECGPVREDVKPFHVLVVPIVFIK